jgi:hypothetical protein
MKTITPFSIERTMRRLPFTLVAPFAVVAVWAACSKDATFPEPAVPQASITWVNAVSDTGQLDFRIIDIPTNAGFPDANFRSALNYPQGIQSGARHIRVFQSDSLPQNSKVVLLDTTFTFQANEPYSFTLSGFARSGKTPGLKAIIDQPTVPTPPPGQFAIRVLNLAPSLAGATPALTDTTVATDAFVLKNTALPTGAPNITNVAFGQASVYVSVDTGNFYSISLTPTGAGTPVFAQAALPHGQAGTSVSNPIGGSGVAGTVMTAVILPRSVAGSKAPQTRPASRITDSSTAEAARRITLSTDTVTVQVGSISILTNRGTGKADSTVGITGTGATPSVSVGDVVLVAGATQPEYNGWHVIIQGSGALGGAGVADSLSCAPTSANDTKSKCAAANAVATTRFRFRYRIVGTPVSPGTGSVTYRLYTPLSTADFAIPFVTFVIDKRPPNTAQ